jgi:hypothetical protein
MEVISSNVISKKFKTIPEYKMDLGLSINVDDSGKKGKDYVSAKWVIKDKTVKKYFDTFDRYLRKNGKIGTLLFYVDYEIRNNDIFIIHNDEIYKSEYDNSNIRNFLSVLINKILDGELLPYEKLITKKVSHTDLKHMSSKELAEYLSKNQ